MNLGFAASPKGVVKLLFDQLPIPRKKTTDWQSVGADELKKIRRIAAKLRALREAQSIEKRPEKLATIAGQIAELSARVPELPPDDEEAMVLMAIPFVVLEQPTAAELVRDDEEMLQIMRFH